MVMADFRALLHGRSRNAATAWLATVVMVLAAGALLATADWLWAAFALLVVGVVIVPPFVTHDVETPLPGELVAVVAIPVAARSLGLFPEITPFVTMAGLALLLLLVLDEFTSLEMAPRFAVLFVVVVTMAFAGAWVMAQFAADALVGTEYVEGQRDLNLALLTATVVSLVAGIVCEAYFRETDGEAPLSGRSFGLPFRDLVTGGQPDMDDDSDPEDGDRSDGTDEEPDAMDVDEADDGVEESPLFRYSIRGLQAILVIIVAYSIVTVHPSLFVNSAVPLALTLLPAIARRRYDYPMHAPLALLIALAATLHAVGALGPYQQTNWWDTMTHALSSTLVAGVGYTIAHSLELHTDRVEFSPKFRGVFIVMFVLAVGVLWEILEFASGIAAGFFGGEVLAQYGASDIVKDLAFNTVGAIIVALWGTQLFRRPARKLTGSVGELLR